MDGRTRRRWRARSWAVLAALLGVVAADFGQEADRPAAWRGQGSGAAWASPPAPRAPRRLSGSQKRRRGGQGPSDRELARLMVEGHGYYRRGNYLGALERYERAAKLRPDAPGPLLGLGKCKMHLSDYPAAKRALQRAEKITRASKRPRVLMRVVFAQAELGERSGEFEDARTAWKTYIELAEASKDKRAKQHLASARQRLAAVEKRLAADAVARKVRARVDGGADGGSGSRDAGVP